MRMPAYLAALFLSLFLTACGGGGDPVVSDTSTDAGDTGTTGSDTDDVTTSSVIDTPAIGTGTGDSFQAGVLSVNTNSLSAGGSTQITATIVDAGNNNKKIASEEYTIIFSSSCESDGRAEFSKEEVTTSSGDVTVTYTAKGCSGDDFITFGLYPSGATGAGDRLAVASGTITVAPPEVGAITYVGVDAPLISLATIGDAVLPKLATVTFKVVDTANNPIVNQTVDFELSSSAGGLSLSIDSSVTNEAGEVSAVVLAGSTHTDAVVRATTLATDGTTKIFTSSQNISVTTGIADQDSFVIALDKFSTWGWGQFGEGTEINVTAYVNDHFQNPVPDGTIVNFAADAGHIDSACQTSGGSCSVIWYSTAPLPGSDESGDIFLADGTRPYDINRVTVDPAWNGGLPGVGTIVAYTSGEAGYSDANGNNLYDSGESFKSYAEAFLDANENGVYDYDQDTNPREDLFDFNGDGSFTSAPSTYQGASCLAGDTVNCQSLMHVRDSASFIVASANVSTELISVVGSIGDRDVTASTCVVLGKDERVTYTYALSDLNGHVPPAGTKVDLNAGELTLLGSTGSEVLNNQYSTNGWNVSFFVEGDYLSPIDGVEKPLLIVEQVDGLEVTNIDGPKVTDNQSVTVTPDQLPASLGTLTLSFTDVCDAAVGVDLVVVAELSNGNFDSGSSGVVFKSYTVLAGATLDIDIFTDGVSSFDSEGLSLTIYPAGSTLFTELSVGVFD
jgi:hypothetical protein